MGRPSAESSGIAPRESIGVVKCHGVYCSVSFSQCSGPHSSRAFALLRIWRIVFMDLPRRPAIRSGENPATARAAGARELKGSCCMRFITGSSVRASGKISPILRAVAIASLELCGARDESFPLSSSGLSALHICASKFRNNACGATIGVRARDNQVERRWSPRTDDGAVD